MNGVTQREWSFLLLLWGLSDPRIAELREMPQSFIIKLYSETQVSGRLGMSGGISPRHAQNPLSGERRKTLSITHHALSPQPSHHHLYIIHLINWLQRFCRIIMSLKRPFVPKSDVKQWFTTTLSHDTTTYLGKNPRPVLSFLTKHILWEPGLIECGSVGFLPNSSCRLRLPIWWMCQLPACLVTWGD